MAHTYVRKEKHNLLLIIFSIFLRFHHKKYNFKIKYTKIVILRRQNVTFIYQSVLFDHIFTFFLLFYTQVVSPFHY